MADDRIFHATVNVPVKLDDNGVNHDLVFWGGVTAPSYDVTENLIAPSVDWAIVDKVKLPKEEMIKKLAERYSYSAYNELPEDYKRSVSEVEFNTAVKEMKDRQAAESLKRREAAATKEKAEHEALLKLPKEDLKRNLAERYFWMGYDKIPDDLKDLVSKEGFDSAVVQLKEKQAAAAEATKAKRKADLLALPKDKLLRELSLFASPDSYDRLEAEFKSIISKEDFIKAVEERKKELESQDGWK